MKNVKSCKAEMQRAAKINHLELALVNVKSQQCCSPALPLPCFMNTLFLLIPSFLPRTISCSFSTCFGTLAFSQHALLYCLHLLKKKKRSPLVLAPSFAHGGITGWFLDPGNVSLSTLQAVFTVLDGLHESILWVVGMSVLHEICRAWCRTTELLGTWSAHLTCIQTVPTCCGPPMFIQSHTDFCVIRLRLGADTCR